MDQQKIPCVYMRGGTSKALFFHEKDLPNNRMLWPEIFLKAMGTPDVKQIDGMGGTASSTSKIAVIAPSQRPGIDVDYTFCQVGVAHPSTDFGVNCGNISSAVGPFAIDEGLVPPVEPITTVRIYNTNTNRVIEAHVPVQDGHAQVYGEEQIAGVPGSGARIDLYFVFPGGIRTGKLFPTGQKKESLPVPGYDAIEATIVDCSHPVIFVRAKDLGLSGSESSLAMEQNRPLMEKLEHIRASAAQKLGFVNDWKLAAQQSAAAPDIVLVSSPQSYTTLNGDSVCKTDMELCVRAVCMGMAHKAYPVTTSIATAAATRIPGTILYELATHTSRDSVRLGHASGIMPVSIHISGETVLKAGVIRTARRIMDGFLYIK